MIFANVEYDESYDVIVVGYGGAGAVAAITAHDCGATVLILEKQPPDTPTEIRHTPSTRMCGAMFICPTNPHQAAEYLKHCSRGTTAESICEVWAKYAVENADWLRKRGAQVFEFRGEGPEFPMFPGAESIRVFGVKYKGLHGGEALFRLLSDQVNSRRIQVIYDTPARKLIADNNRQVVGVTTGKETTFRARRAVILTCGGFEWDDEMKLDYLRADPFYFYCNPANTGDGVRMAQDVGAALWHMNAISGRVIPKIPGMIPAMMGGTPRNRFILVDKYGRRFVKERPLVDHSFWLEVCYFDTQRAEYPRIPCYSIFDEAARLQGPVASSPPKGALSDGKMRYFYRWSHDNLVEVEKGWIIKGGTVEELACKLGMDRGILESTIAEYNDYCKSGVDREFARARETLVPIDRPPYYGMQMFPGGPNTQGGPRRNSKAQVLDVFGNPIRRLYAAGELGSIYGFLYPASGGNVAELIAFGRIAGENAAAERCQ